MRQLTNVYEASGRAFTKLFRLVAKCDLYDAGDVSGRGLHSDRMRRYQLEQTDIWA